MALTKLAQMKKYFSCYLLILPTYLLLSVFSFIPFFWAFSTSFYEFEIGEQPRFVALSIIRSFWRTQSLRSASKT